MSIYNIMPRSWQTKRKRFEARCSHTSRVKYFPTRKAAQDWLDQMKSIHGAKDDDRRAD